MTKPALLLVALLPAALASCARAAGPGAAVPGAATPASATAGVMVDGMPLLRGTIDGQPVTLLLDTGASLTCLQPPAIERLGRRAVGQTRIGGVGDTTYTVISYGAASLALGDDTASIARLHGCPTLSQLGLVGRPIDGVIGSDALRGLVVVIDYPADVVRIAPAWSGPADSAATLPVTFIGNLPIISVVLPRQGQWEAVSLLLDTGADASLLLGADLAATLDLEAERHAPAADRHGLGGIIATSPHHVDRARIGALDVRELAVEVAQSGLTQLFQHGVQGIVGAEFLRHFVVQLDLGNARISVNAPGPGRSVCATRSGICVSARPGRDGYIVQVVRPRSIAARSGVLPGETIVRVGAADAARMSAAELRGALAASNGLVSLWIRSSFDRVRRVDFRIGR